MKKESHFEQYNPCTITHRLSITIHEVVTHIIIKITTQTACFVLVGYR